MQHRAGQTEALLHAPREAHHLGLLLMAEVYERQQVGNQLGATGGQDGVGGGKEVEVFRRLHVVVDAEEVGHEPNLPPHRRSLAHHRMARHISFTVAWQQQRGENPHGRRLPRAIWPDEAVNRPLRNAQIQMIEGDHPAIAPRQVAGLDNDCHVRSAPGVSF